MSMITFIVAVALCSLCAARNLGEMGYIPCTSCQVPDIGSIPEGYRACYQKKTARQLISQYIGEDCTEICLPRVGCYQKCEDVWENITILTCSLHLTSSGYTEIPSFTSEHGTFYYIFTPKYHRSVPYPNNRVCYWNVANSGEVNYRIIEQELQEPENCSTQGCSCPDTMEVIVGKNKDTLCGHEYHSYTSKQSSNGLKAFFCSDNKIGEKGVHIEAFKPNHDEESLPIIEPKVDNTETHQVEERQVEEVPEGCAAISSKMQQMSQSIDQMGCQYEFMMRMAQPDVKCPPIEVIKELIDYDGYLMGEFNQNLAMCKGMEKLSSNLVSSLFKNPMMNKIEGCALQYLYTTRDCQFAKQLVNSTTNGELSDIASMIVGNKLFLPFQQKHNETTICN